jgi:uncharacterized Zn finger protein
MSELKYNKEEIIKALNEKGANLPCHRCGHTSLSVIEGFSRYHLSDSMDANVIGGQGVPIVLVACNKCGAITPHAALALVKSEDNAKKKEGEQNGN